MKEPHIAARAPAVLDLKPGAYWWCACGLSQNQPMCDGSHKGHGFSPLKFEITEEKRAALCVCKHSGNKPFCDGTHATLPPATGE